MTRRIFWYLLAWLCLVSANPALANDYSGAEILLSTAELRSSQGISRVQLPHALEKAQFAPDGDTVRYRMEFQMHTLQGYPAIYIPKMSRSGRVYLNGKEIGACGYFSLDQLRCHHQPQFFRPPPDRWREGLNTLEVDIFANKRQTNGLSGITIADTERLYNEEFRPHFRWQVDMIDWLASVMLGLGLLSLITFSVFRNRTIYLWFGLTCLAEALSSLNILVTAPTFSFFWFDWIVFTSRLVATCFLGLTFVAFFHKDRPWFARSLLLYALACAVAVAWLDNDPQYISKMYLPLQGVTVLLTLNSIRWAWQSRKFGEWVMAGILLTTLTISFADLARLRGGANFTGVYLMAYASSIMLVFIGLTMISLLILALKTSRDWSGMLQQKLHERENSLRKVYDQLLVMEGEKARSAERERLMRDMHDGFMSTLAITRVGLLSGKTSVAQAATYIGDCLDDLRLVLDAATNVSGSLDAMLADFMHRFERRMILAGIEPDSEIALEGMPGLSSSELLHVMRLLQEAVNNVIRHANARHLNLSARWDSATRQLRIEVVDDGQNPPRHEFKVGRGLTNMRNRAIALNGHLDIRSSESGTSVRMTMPLASG